MHPHLDRRPRVVLHRDVLVGRDERDLVQRLVVVLDVGVRLGGAVVIVERHARRDDVQHRRATVGDRRLEHCGELLLVAGKAAPDEGRPELDGEKAGVDRWQIVHHAALGGRAGVGGGAELALGQTVHSVVLDDVDQREVAPHEVDELADADRCRVAVAGDTQAHQGAVGQQRAGGNRWHPPMHRVESVGAAHEVGRRLRGAADAGELGHALWGDAELEHRFEDALADGVVAAACAESGLSALVVGLGEPDAVGLLGHVQRPSRAAISSVTLRASRGSPGMWATDFRRGPSSAGRSSLRREAIWPSRFCSTT